MSEFVVAIVSLIVLVYLVYSNQAAQATQATHATQAASKAEDSSLLSTAARLTEVSKARTETARELRGWARNRRTLSEPQLGDVPKLPLHLLQGALRQRRAAVSYEVASRQIQQSPDNSLESAKQPKLYQAFELHSRHNSQLYTPEYGLN